MQSQSFSGINVHIHTCIHAHASNCLLKSEDDRQPCSHLISRSQTYISWIAPLLSTFESALITYTTSYCLLDNLVEDNRRTYALSCPRLITFTNTHTPHGAFLFYTYRSASLTLMQHCTQLTYLFDQCEKSLFSRDGRIACCIVYYFSS